MSSAILKRAFYCALCAICLVSIGHAQVFTEDWDTGTIDSGTWSVAGHNGTDHFVGLVDLGSGDYALKMGNSGLDWTTFIRGVNSFPRGDNLRVTFKFWGDPNDASFVQQYPNTAGIHGPWHSTGDTGTPIYNDIDAGFDFWHNTLSWEESGSASGIQSANPTIGGDFGADLVNAVDKASALIIRVWVGDASGAAFDYSADGGATFKHGVSGAFASLDTRGLAQGPTGIDTGTATPLFLGFSTAQAAVFIDDIKVETDSNNDGQDPGFTPAPGGADDTLPFVERWTDGVDTDFWTVAGDNPPMFAMRVIDPGDGNPAFIMGNHDLSWATKIRSKAAWPRGNNLRCTFRVWGRYLLPPSGTCPDGQVCEDDTVFDFRHRFPGAGGIHGPFHSSVNIADAIYNTVEAGLDAWWTAVSIEEGGGANGQLQFNNPAGNQTFQDSFSNARSRATSLKIRVWAGDTSGMFIEWSNDDGQTYMPLRIFGSEAVYDTRGLAEFPAGIPTGSASPLSLGFSTAQSGVYIDDIIVENDLFPFVDDGGGGPPNDARYWSLY